MNKKYVFDTSAIFVYTKAEEGSDTIEEILKLSKEGKCIVYISFITLMEIYYITWQERDEDIAKEIIVLVKSLPIEIIESIYRIILSSLRIK